MENIIFRYFLKNYDISLTPELPLINGGRADLGIAIKDCETHLIEMIIVEIKQSWRDMYSGYGLNFIGSSNYLAVPSDLLGFAVSYLQHNMYKYVGVLEVCNNGYVRRIIEPEVYSKSPYFKYGYILSHLTPYHLRTKEVI